MIGSPQVLLGQRAIGAQPATAMASAAMVQARVGRCGGRVPHWGLIERAGEGTRILDAVADDSRGRGRLTTRYVNRPRGTDEQIHLVVKRLDRGAYTLVAIDDSDNETEIGRFRAISRAGVGVLHLDTRQGTNVAASVLDLGGQRAEVRDADGNAVLRGRFPDVL